MKIRIRSLLIAVAVAALILAGVAYALRHPGRPYSTVFDRFDPVVLFSTQPGFSVNGVAGLGTFNKRAGGAFKEWRGFVGGADRGSTPSKIQEVIETYLRKECQGRSISGVADAQPSDVRVPSHVEFLFNQGDRHGEMHVWLFPDSSGSGFGYVVSLQEERLE